jgi:hypothetical protein
MPLQTWGSTKPHKASSGPHRQARYEGTGKFIQLHLELSRSLGSTHEMEQEWRGGGRAGTGGCLNSLRAARTGFKAKVT